MDMASVEKFSRGESLGRPHLAHAMVEKGLVKDFTQAFDIYLRSGAKYYVPRAKMGIPGSINLIREAGGVPVLAHPGLIKNFKLHWPRILSSGIMGIEAYYPQHSLAQISYFIQLAKENNLVVTAGTDYHGIKVNGIKKPGYPVSMKVFNDFFSFCKKNVRVV